MQPTVFVDGDQGTTGLLIHEHLSKRNDVALVSLASEHRKESRHRAEALNSCDIAILCLPDDAARDAVAMIRNPAVRVIDASSAHRTEPAWVYGFPEMTAVQEEHITSAKRVANPGCYPTGAIALLRPLLAAGLIAADYPITINAVSGYSGRGRAGVEEYEGFAVSAKPAFQVYGLGLAHKHVPEIEKHAGLTARPLFVPAYGAFRQGIVLTIALHRRLLAAQADSNRIQECLALHYARSRHVKVLTTAQCSAQEYLDPQLLNGSNDMQLAVFANDAQGQILLTAIFDNLGKGASGAVVQNLELMLRQS